MDSIQFSEFSTTGVNISDTFDIWRQKTNGVVTELTDLRNDISPLFYSTGQNSSSLLRTVTLDTPQTITGAKTFSGGTANSPALKIGNSGLYELDSILLTTTPIQVDKLILQSQLQFGVHSYGIPNNNPSEASILGKSGNSLSWTTLSSIISQVQSEGAANVVTTNIVLPVGSIQAYGSITVPTGWLSCDGSRFIGSDYPQLATLLLNTYAPIYTSQSGSTVAGNVSYNPNWWYTLPDLRGRFALGVGTGNDGVNSSQSFTLGGRGGKYAHSLITAELPSHSHTTSTSGSHSHIIKTADVFNTNAFVLNDQSGDKIVSSDNTPTSNSLYRDNRYTTESAGDHTHTIGNTGSGTAHSIIQPYLVTNYIIKATPDSVVNTFIDRGNVFDIIRGTESIQSLSLANGGTGVLNLRHDPTLTVNVDRQLGIAESSITPDKLATNSVDPSKLSLGGPSWDSASATLFEGNDPNTRRRVATREYVDELVFKKGPAAKLVNKPSHAPHSSAPGFGEFCYINHDGVPIITGSNGNSRFGYADKYSHCEMPLPDNRKAVELHVTRYSACVLDNEGELWAIGIISHNLYNMVPFPGTANAVSTVKEWTKAYNPLYNYSAGNKIKKVIISGGYDINNVAVIDTSNRLWIAGYNQYGILGRGNNGTTTTNTATKPAGETTPVLENVFDACIIGTWNGTAETATCIALTSTGIRVSGYGSTGLRGDGLNPAAVNSTFNVVTIPDITDYSSCRLYAGGEDSATTAFLVSDSGNVIYGWGYNGNGILGDNTTSNKNRPTVIWEDPNLNIDKVYTTTHTDGTGAAYIFGSKNNATTKLGADITTSTSGHLLGTSISSSDTANIIATSSPGIGTGRVQCYQYSGTAWNAYGAVINGSENASNFGNSVSLSSSGNRLAIGVPDGQRVGTNIFGQVRIYDYSGGAWSQLGTNLNGSQAGSKFGGTVALSGDGNTFIVGAPNTSKSFNGTVSTLVGQVRAYSITGTTITQLGSAIDGSSGGQYCGSAVAINNNGTIIAVSSGGNANAGVVRVYQLVSGQWSQLGGDLAGKSANDNSNNISLSGSGTRIAIGAPGVDDNGLNSGQVRIFEYNQTATTWEQLGTNINGSAAGYASGSAVVLSRDGQTLAIGTPNADTLGKTDNGYVRLYRLSGNSWKLLTGNLSGENSTEKSGSVLALSSNGNTVIIGAPTYNANRGLVRAITFSSTPTITNELWCSGTNTGNKFGITGNSNQWRLSGLLTSGYSLEDFWCGNGFYSDNVNFAKAYRASDNKYYLFAVGKNDRYQSGNGSNVALNTWTRLNLSSEIVEKIVDIQCVSPYGSEDYTILLLDDGSLYFSGYNAYMIDPNLPNNTYRTDFTRIK